MKNKNIWHKLHNGYWLKVRFLKASKYFHNSGNLWFVDIAVGKSKRQVNDHYNTTQKSPKKLRNKSTNNKGGLEALRLTLQDIQEFIKILPSGSKLQIEGSDEQRRHVYSRLLRYGFIGASWYAPENHWHKQTYYWIEVK